MELVNMDANKLSLNALGFLRTAVVSPELRVADVSFNTSQIVEALAQAARQGCQVAVFPELAITGYTCGDLFYQAHLLEQARTALPQIAEAAGRYGVATVVGLPLVVEGRLFNCAAFIAEHAVLGIVPKTYLPSTNEYYEER